VTLGGDLLGPGHVGRVLPGVAVRIGAGEDDSEPAEIFIRGDNLFSGYWPDGRDGPDAEGWFATGDIGYLRGGELFLVDRARELIVVNGFHVYPAEIEDVISDLPGVAAVAVLGRPADGRGDQVVAFVVGRNVQPETVLDHCAQRLPKFKRPTELHLVADLPRGATGKIRKGALRRMLDDPVNHQTTTSSAGTTKDRS
jgi:long-chain acyl-CoA synthetase